MHPSAGVAKPGTFAGLAEKIPYLQKLGVTAVDTTSHSAMPASGRITKIRTSRANTARITRSAYDV